MFFYLYIIKNIVTRCTHVSWKLSILLRHWCIFSHLKMAQWGLVNPFLHDGQHWTRPAAVLTLGYNLFFPLFLTLLLFPAFILFKLLNRWSHLALSYVQLLGLFRCGSWVHCSSSSSSTRQCCRNADSLAPLQGTESEIWSWDSSVWFNKISRWFWQLLQCKERHAREWLYSFFCQDISSKCLRSTLHVLENPF